jgi:hypothetical protein
LLLILGYSNITFAAILNVPDQYATISAAISRAGARDTIVIADGEYSGAGFVGLTISSTATIMSENGPAACIINGGGAGTVTGITITGGATIIGLTFTRFTNNAIILTSANGFTLRDLIITGNVLDNGTTSGGGIYSSGSSGLIEMCLFTENSTGGSAPAIYVGTNSDFIIDNCIFIENNAARYGGAILITGSGSSCQINNSIFNLNQAGIDGGAIALSVSASTEITFCNFIENSCTNFGGGINKGSNSNAEVLNCIFWGNRAENQGHQLYAEDNGGEITINYCLVEGGVGDGSDNWNGEEILDAAPRFAAGRQPDWGLPNWFLDRRSAGIDAGSDPAADIGMDEFTTQTTLAPDQDDVDLGYHYPIGYFPILGAMWGYVRRASDQRPIAGALVSSSLGQETETGGDGYWEIGEAYAEREFSITVSAWGYNDTTVTDLVIEEDAVVRLDFGLCTPVFRASNNAISLLLYREDDTYNHNMTIYNDGDGFMEWSFIKRPPGVVAEAWEMRQSHAAAQICNDTRLLGVVFVDGFFYITGANTDGEDDTRLIYKVNKQGELVESIPQVGDSTSRYGMTDITYDGENLWGSGMDSVYCFSTEGEKITCWNGPYNPNRAMTWDSDREVLWITSRPSAEIFAYDRDGNEILEINGHGLSTYGLAYFPDDPDGFTLYSFTSTNDTTQGIYKINPETEQFRFVASLANPDVGTALGCCMTNKYDRYSWVFMGMINEAVDRLEIYQVAASMTWVQSDVLEGRIEAQQSQDLTMTINIPEMPSDTAQCDLVFEHNTVAMETVIRLTAMRSDSDVDQQAGLKPTEFNVSEAYPNPFNSTSLIRYAVPKAGIVTAELYDISGRAISTIISERQSAGIHQAVIDGADLPAGLYFFRLTADEHSSVRKIALVK